MFINKMLPFLFSVGLSLSFSTAQAAPININGHDIIQLKLCDPDEFFQCDPYDIHLRNKTKLKPVKLMHVELSPAAKQQFINRYQHKPLARHHLPGDALPKSVSLNMANVPVLDQGMHGSCVTFAVTAVMDSYLRKGDYISQLCHLELGRTIEFDDEAYISGWNGSMASRVLNQIEQFGVMNKSFEKIGVCNSELKRYPVNDPFVIGDPIDYATFDQHAEKVLAPSEQAVSDQITYQKILTIFDFFDEEENPLDNAGQITQNAFDAVKEAIADGQRVTFGVLLDIGIEDGLFTAGASGKTKARNDTWYITDEVLKNLYDPDYFFYGAHEMVITGYDDQKTFRDKEGEKVTSGMFILRNSWSKKAGDKGNYYMTYDYFKALVMEAHRYYVKHDVSMS